jgi:hypothetical protein
MERNKPQLSYYQRNKEKLKEYRNRPEIRERTKEYQREYFQRRKSKHIIKKDEDTREVKIVQNVLVSFF